ncbi:hypothetical protein EYR41_011421 [Orbilia oligospora]|uniref:Uncharacterized protein n=1 Tax=Orbilia oligospora TaxID=2813651 RepID=A0A8H2DKV6_ORBOL|nr:hypothetical protein EYR41_011421 [Orbilia oligospora]
MGFPSLQLNVEIKLVQAELVTKLPGILPFGLAVLPMPSPPDSFSSWLVALLSFCPPPFSVLTYKKMDVTCNVGTGTSCREPDNRTFITYPLFVFSPTYNPN